MNRARWAGQVIDAINLDVKRQPNIVTNQLELLIADQVTEIILAAGMEVIGAQDVAAFGDQALAQVRADE